MGVEEYESRFGSHEMGIKESELRKRSCTQIEAEWDLPNENGVVGVTVLELLSGPCGLKGTNC